MTPRLAILSGARAGAVEELAAGVTSIGRHPTCRVRLDADLDTEVSNRHAVIHHQDGAWTVRDLGSLHGTYLNGTRIASEQPLNDGDMLRLGAAGPQLQFLLSERAPAAQASVEPMDEQPAVPAMSPEKVAQVLEEQQAGQLARELVEQEAKRKTMRTVLGVVLAVGVIGAAIFAWQKQAARKAEAAAHQLEILRADSLIASVASIAVGSTAMQASLDSARQAAAALRAALGGAGPDPVVRAPIMTDLESAVARQRQIGAASAFDPGTVTGSSAAAVGLVVAQYGNGTATLATGFAVRRDGTGGVLLTTRSAVTNAQGDMPTQVTVVMPGITQPVPAQIIATHPVEDIALLRLNQQGGIAVVQGLGWRDPAVGTGEPVAVIGYPPPLDLPLDGDLGQASVATTMTTGSAARVAPGFITIDGWGMVLAAGSPIFDHEGLVAGLISTAAPAARGRLYDAVPVKFALELLDQLQ